MKRTPAKDSYIEPDCYGQFTNEPPCVDCPCHVKCHTFGTVKTVAIGQGRDPTSAELVARLATVLTEGSEVPDCMEFDCDCSSLEEVRDFDREVFAKWPDHLCFVRPMLWFEKADIERREGVLIESNHVVVLNVGKGMRMKYPATCGFDERKAGP